MRKHFHDVLSFLLIHILLLIIRLAFRPKLEYASEKARQEAFSEPRVIICNHVRGMDGAVIYSLIRHEKVIALTAKDLQVGHPFFAAFMSLLPTMAIDREHPSLSWLRDSRKLLKSGKHIMIFPEGKCQFDRVTKPFKEGCVMLAAASGTQILPIYHNGIYHYFLGRRFRMIIGEPVTLQSPPVGLESDVMKQESEQLFHIMNDLERQLTGHVRTVEKLQEEA